MAILWMMLSSSISIRFFVFESISWLKINGGNYFVIGINCDRGKVSGWASLVDCEAGLLPSSYWDFS